MNDRLWQDGRLGKPGKTPQVVFAQVREDADIELEVLRSLPEGETALCIASGGCTAFALLLAKPSRLHVVDVNPAQIALVELKIAALHHLPYVELLACMLKNAQPFYAALRPHLGAAAQNFWDSQPRLLKRGLNNCGLIENHLRQTMRFLPLVQRRRNVRRLFAAESLQEQRDIYESAWNHRGWELAFQFALSKPALQRVYGSAAMDGVPQTLARDLKQRVDEAFTRYPIGENGYLWQFFHGIYPPQDRALPLYLQRENQSVVQSGLENLQLQSTDAARYLEAQSPDSIGFFALSNILEMASPDFTHRLLRAVARAAKPNAKIFLRSLFAFDDAFFQNVRLEDGARFERLPSQTLEDRDRSVFCKNLLLLRVLKP